MGSIYQKPQDKHGTYFSNIWICHFTTSLATKLQIFPESIKTGFEELFYAKVNI